MENQNDNSTNNTFQQAEVVTPVENKVVEETKKEKKEVEKPENDETSEEETVEMELPDLDEIKSDLTDEKEDVWKF